MRWHGGFGVAGLVCVAAFVSLPAASVAELVDGLERIDDERLVLALLAGSRDLAGLPVGERLQLADGLAPLAARCFGGPERLPGMERLGLHVHRVASGESPRRILKRWGMRNAYLERLNPDYDDTRLGVGQELKVHDQTGAAQAQLVVSKQGYRCLVFHWLPAEQQHVLWAAFPVGIGATERPTPVGRTTVSVAVRDPTWTHPDTKEVIPAGDPRNVLGGFWIGLDPGDGRFRSIGFHGYTGAPVDDWLEQGGSRGCLRLRQDDIQRLFGIARKGMPVLIE